MDKRKLITRIALGVAAAALIFSIITLIRAIVLGAGVAFAVVQVIGTLIIVAICAVMLYVIRREEESEEAKGIEEADETETADPEPDEPFTEDIPDDAAETTQNDKYHFDNFT